MPKFRDREEVCPECESRGDRQPECERCEGTGYVVVTADEQAADYGDMLYHRWKEEGYGK